MERKDLEALSEDEKARLPKGDRMFLADADLSGEADKIGREISDLVSAIGLTASKCHDLILEGNAVEIAMLIAQKPSANGHATTHVVAKDEEPVDEVPQPDRCDCWSPGMAARCVLNKGHAGQHIAWSSTNVDLRWDQGKGRS